MQIKCVDLANAQAKEMRAHVQKVMSEGSSGFRYVVSPMTKVAIAVLSLATKHFGRIAKIAENANSEAEFILAVNAEYGEDNCFCMDCPKDKSIGEGVMGEVGLTIQKDNERMTVLKGKYGEDKADGKNEIYLGFYKRVKEIEGENYRLERMISISDSGVRILDEKLKIKQWAKFCAKGQEGRQGTFDDSTFTINGLSVESVSENIYKEALPEFKEIFAMMKEYLGKKPQSVLKLLDKAGQGTEESAENPGLNNLLKDMDFLIGQLKGLNVPPNLAKKWAKELREHHIRQLL